MEAEIQKQITSLQLLNESGKLDGEFKDVPNEAYHHPDCPGISRSSLITARKSVAKYFAQINGELEKNETPALKFGNMFHDYILEPEQFKGKYYEPYSNARPEGDARKTEANGGCKEAFIAWKKEKAEYDNSHFPKEEIDLSDLGKLKGMKASMMDIDIVRHLFESGEAEFENSYFFKDEKTSLLQKFRPDIILKDKKIMIDLKSCLDASPLGFGKAMANNYYDVQGASYCKGAAALFGGDWTFAYLAVEKAAPYTVGLHTLGSAEKEVGEEILRECLDLVASLDHDNRPNNSYGDNFQDCALPSWAYTPGYR